MEYITKWVSYTSLLQEEVPQPSTDRPRTQISSRHSVQLPSINSEQDCKGHYVPNDDSKHLVHCSTQPKQHERLRQTNQLTSST